MNLSVEEFIGKKITPELEKLGLQYQVQNLENELFKEYSQKCKVNSQDEFMKLSVGDVKKNIKAGVLDAARSKIVMATTAKIAENDEEDRLAI